MAGEEDLKTLEVQVKQCAKCALRAGCTQVVVGLGQATSKLVLIGEAPGADEDSSGRPFVGRSGRLLREVLHKNGIKESHYYITNTVRCRPPENRTPTPEEMEACWPWLAKTLQIVKPKIVVTLGKPALFTLALKYGFTKKTGQLPITKLAGRPIYMEARKFYVYPVLHPAFALRRSEAMEEFRAQLTFLAKAIPGWIERP